jgi:hypothetical protein
MKRWARIPTSPMDIDVPGAPLARKVPSTHSTSSGAISIALAAMRIILSRIKRDAPRVAPDSMIVRRLPPGPADNAPVVESA